MDVIDPDITNWEISPRFDKFLPELQYKLKDLYSNEEQSELYLKALGKDPKKLKGLFQT